MNVEPGSQDWRNKKTEYFLTFFLNQKRALHPWSSARAASVNSCHSRVEPSLQPPGMVLRESVQYLFILRLPFVEAAVNSLCYLFCCSPLN